MVPNLICLGAQKAGTTTLNNLLNQHPDIYSTIYKEVYYFSNKKNYKKGIKWYENFFKPINREKYIMEATTDYLNDKNSAKRIYETLKDNVQFIVILRNPIERAYSQYKMRKREGKEKEEFCEVLLKDYKKNRDYSYIYRGLYYKQIKKYLKYYDISKFHFILFEDLINKKDIVLKKLYKFLNIEEIKIENDVFLNKDFIPKRKLVFKILKIIPNRYKILIKKVLRINKKGITRKIVGESFNKNIKLDYNKFKRIYLKDINNLSKLIKKDLKIWKIN